jgi:YrbI family 3-deoxy-D-manno-octulosonate 8-phosphate phosphatase
MWPAPGDCEFIMDCLAIIPARGGSKGIPYKNIQLLDGKPLIAYSIEQSLASKLITRVVVSTDDEKIGSVAELYGAEVIWRPKEISGDTASSEAALLHVLHSLKKNENYQPDLLVFLQCTSPLTLAEDIDGTIESLIKQNADSALAVIPFHYFVWEQNDEGEALGINHDKNVRLLRQERKPQYLETGAVYVMRTPEFLRAKHRFFGKTALYLMPSERRWEIDEPNDLEIAEILLKQMQSIMKRQFPQRVEALVLDFDGVFTDNTVIVFQDGKEAVVCDRSDGMGLSLIKKLNIPVWVLSSESNSVGKRRCEKLGVPCYHNLGGDKASTLAQLLTEHNIAPENVIYVGNDVNDISCMAMVGYAAAVSDAHPEVQKQADLVLQHAGGHGAIREICDLLLNA